MSKKKGLGRGVGALLDDSLVSNEESKYFLCDIDKIKPNPDQPRSYFDDDKLNLLAESIRTHGIIQPLLVIQSAGNRYTLIAGERRLRAAKIAGEDEVPVIISEETGQNESLELALIENIQRQDLNPIEEAMAYSRLIKEFKLTQDQVAGKVGRKRSTVTNVLRLLKLPDTLQNDVSRGIISEGHGRVLLRLKDDNNRMQEIRDRIINEELSVRQTENLCRQKKNSHTGKPKAGVKNIDELPASYCRTLSTQLTNQLNTKVSIVQNGSRGKLEIAYYSPDDLDRLISMVGGDQ